MPRSSSIWGAALVLATLCGPMLTTAEAMPAPGPQQTQMRPRYYFPRHIKRQIVTNATEPAVPTPSPPTPESTSELETRQSSKKADLELSIDLPLSPPQKVSSTTPSSPAKSADTTPPSSDSPVVLPAPTTLPADTSEAKSQPSTASPEPVSPPNAERPSNGLPSLPSELPSLGVTGGPLPPVIVSPSPSAPPAASSDPAGSSDNPETRSVDTDTDVGTTGGLPLTTLLPTLPKEEPSPLPTNGPTAVPDASTPSDAPVGSSTGLPDTVIPPAPTPQVPAPPAASPGDGSSTIVGPFIIGSSGTGGLLDTTLLPTLPIPSDGILPSVVPGSTDGLPPSVIPAITSELPSLPIPSVTPPTSGILVGITTALGLTDTPISPESTPTPSPETPVTPPAESAPTQSPETPVSPPAGLAPSTSPEIPGSASLTSDPAPIPTSETTPDTTPNVVPSVTDSAPLETPPAPTPSDGLTGSGTGITDPTPTPTDLLPSISIPIPTDLLPSLSIPIGTGSSLIPDLSSPPSLLPTPPTDLPISTDLPTPTDVPVSPSSGSEPTPTVSPTDVLPPSSPTSDPTPSDSGVFPPSSSGSGVTGPTGSGTDPTVTPEPTPTPSPSSPSEPTPTGPSVTSEPGTGIPTSETLPTPSDTESPASTPQFKSPPSDTSFIPTGSDASPTPTGPSNNTESNTTAAEPTGLITDSSTPPFTATPTLAPSTASTDTVEIPFTFTPTTTPQPPQSLLPTGTDSLTTYFFGSSIIQEQSTASPTTTASGIPTELPRMISPPSGPPDQPVNTFLGQMAFKWPLNYPFVCANDGGNQIFWLLPVAISDALNITKEQVIMQGLKPFDSTAWTGYVTTLALFWIPEDMSGSLQAQLRNPLDPLWHNANPLVNDLTELIDNGFPLPAGKLPGDYDSTKSYPTATAGPRYNDGDAITGDIGSSKKVNPTSVGVVIGAVTGALAYGAAMFYVARRYRNRKMSHQRSNSVPSTSRYTYGSMTGGAAYMSGGRGPGRSTPGGRDSRGSRGSGSSNGRSIRTAQISAPVMAENSLGWN